MRMMMMTAALAAMAVAGSPAAFAQTYWDGHNYYERPQPLPAPKPAPAPPPHDERYDRDVGRHDQNRGRDDAGRYRRDGADARYAPDPHDDYVYSRADRHSPDEPGDGRYVEERGDDWRRDASWGRHVRACMSRYRSYNARTDSYLARPRVWVRCSL